MKLALSTTLSFLLGLLSRRRLQSECLPCPPCVVEQDIAPAALARLLSGRAAVADVARTLGKEYSSTKFADRLQHVLFLGGPGSMWGFRSRGLYAAAERAGGLALT